jgi:glycosyltransferase involved in cell wall biosynthesis
MSAAARLRVHVLYESSTGNLPHGCSEIRLLRPLSHPAIAGDVDLSYGLKLPEHPIDALIVERLWDHSCDWHGQREQFARLRAQGIPILYEIDDDLLTVNSEPGARDWPTEAQRMWLRQIMRFSDGIIVSTPNLAARLRELNPVVEVVPNALDDRLFGATREFPAPAPRDELVFGYMGTFTHVDDLISIAQPLRHALARHRGRVRFEIVGVGDTSLLSSLLGEHPVRFLHVPTESVQYEKFAGWMQANLRWDFGIAPLVDSPFSRSKSDIKFLDYAAQGIPGIFSDVPAYRSTVRHMENGLLATDMASWSAALETLIADATARGRMARHAHQEVWRNRMLAQRAHDWLAAIRKIVASSQRAPKPVHRVVSLACGAPAKNLSREEKVLFGCSRDGLGLEIGASYNPIARKRDGFRVETLDHADAEGLRAKYRNDPTVDIANIEEVDYVWTGQPMHELTGKEDHYDWIIASHVIEHTPDMVSFLKQCERMLKPGGVLCLAIPDRRYCFDVFRPASTPGDVIQAYMEKRSRHTLGTLWDRMTMSALKGGAPAWNQQHRGDYAMSEASIAGAPAHLAEAQRTDEYIDAHNWRFTPASFKLIMLDIALLGYTTLGVANFFDPDGCEFIVQLKKGKEIVPIASAQSERLELLKEMLAESGEPDQG